MLIYLNFNKYLAILLPFCYIYLGYFTWQFGDIMIGGYGNLGKMITNLDKHLLPSPYLSTTLHIDIKSLYISKIFILK